ncbi:GNAT family N-acetyltransferase [Flavimaricola marinus]|uniref:Putative acetyltransferase n=1 Tax=Flavimaricola marinus TaxID=1819565 RepID=A0A238LJ30_9RHOB|nr:GNAT family N-acetyltransferase [Flavimaricola marinus]SMY09661.1 putative acetyltransferase [Flavimaricola marinus]
MAKPNVQAVIRPLRPDDEAAWRPLWSAYLEFYNSGVTDAVYRSSFDRMTDPSVTDYNGLVAEVDGEIVGITHYIYHLHGWRVEKVCYLQDLFVAPQARGMGVAQSLIEAVYAAADAAGCPSVYWMTQEDNATARRLYDRIATLTPFIKYQRRSA